MIFHWSLRVSKFSEVSRTFLSILADLNNLDWMVSIRPLFYNLSSLFFQSFSHRSKCTNYNWYHSHPHALQFFFFLVLVFVYLFDLLYFHSVVFRNGNIHCMANSFFILINTRPGPQFEIGWSICILKSQRILCPSFSTTDFSLCIYHLVVWSNFDLLHNSQWISRI